jgi:hypothetical protein
MKVAATTPGEVGMCVLMANDVPLDGPRTESVPARTYLPHQGVLTPSQYLGSILAHSPYLERYEGDEDVATLLAGAEVSGPPADTIGDPATTVGSEPSE